MSRPLELELGLELPPRRIQRTRARGWRMPPNARYVGRPTRHGNPWRVVSVAGGPRYITKAPPWDAITLPPTPEERLELVDRFRLERHPAGLIEELRGLSVVCWCPLSEPCHGDVWLELANMPATERLSRSIAADRRARGLEP